MFNKKNLFVIVILVSLVAAACGSGAATPTATKAPVVSDSGVVIAEGRLQPKQYAAISFAVGGQIAEVLVSEGAQVKKDDVIIRLKNREALQAEVSRADQERINADQALKDLKDTANVATAQALLDLSKAKDALDRAEKDLRNFKNPDIDYYERQVAKAQDNLSKAQETQQINDIAGLSSALKAARDALKDLKEKVTQTTLNEIETCKDPATCDDKYVSWIGGRGIKLKDARDAYNDAVNRVKVAEIQLEQAQRNVSVQQRDLQKVLDDANQNLKDAANPDALKIAIYEAELAKAKAKVAEAQRNYDKVKSGVDPDKLATAEARVKTANASLEAAKTALANAELKAPFNGTVSEIKLKVGEQVSPGQAVAVIADFANWVVKTNNLTEIEVVKVKEKQKATIKLDAMPDKKLNGTVDSIATFFEEKRGDITYTITITVTDLDPKMMWGMTAQVTFEK